eukprot:TRINITY_DN2998_c0_g1_i3.p2 TRINITY_DN2998_c0_g1~~TRINITY_DN2998_c0_g1_i3.p2  ORF type:complete len:107 (+),score=28.14 TRINITY_DN2998_c0_g1_i3:233-553(+)
MEFECPACNKKFSVQSQIQINEHYRKCIGILEKQISEQQEAQKKYLLTIAKKKENSKACALQGLEAVSYTHLTLPTKRIVQISVVAVSLKKKLNKNKQSINTHCNG